MQFFSPAIAQTAKWHLTPRLGSHPLFSPESARALNKTRNPASIFLVALFSSQPKELGYCSAWSKLKLRL